MPPGLALGMKVVLLCCPVGAEVIPRRSDAECDQDPIVQHVVHPSEPLGMGSRYCHHDIPGTVVRLGIRMIMRFCGDLVVVSVQAPAQVFTG